MIDVIININQKGKLKNKIQCDLPSSFSDLTAEDLFFICNRIDLGYSITDFKLLILQRYAKLSNEDLSLLMANKYLVVDIVRAMDIQINNAECDINLVPFINYNGIQYNGPFGDFSNVTFEQFGTAETLFNLYLETKQMSYLQILVETLYLPGDYHFNATKINKDKQLFNQLSNEKCLAISIVYSAMRRKLFSNYPVLFPIETKKENKNELDEQELITDTGFDYELYENMIRGLADNGHFGHDQETRKAITPNVLFYLNKQAQDEPKRV